MQRLMLISPFLFFRASAETATIVPSDEIAADVLAALILGTNPPLVSTMRKREVHSRRATRLMQTQIWPFGKGDEQELKRSRARAKSTEEIAEEFARTILRSSMRRKLVPIQRRPVNAFMSANGDGEQVRWKVIGGKESGGLLVRKGRELASEDVGQRLAYGSIVEEIELHGDRLHYKLVDGTGPKIGWVSKSLKDKSLLTPVYKENQVEPARQPPEQKEREQQVQGELSENEFASIESVGGPGEVAASQVDEFGLFGPFMDLADDAQSRSVYVGNLDWNVSTQELKDHMRSAGEVASANVLTAPNGKSKGCAIVEYETVEAAKAAIKTLHDTTLGARMIFVREDRGAPKPKGMPANGDSEQPALAADDAQSRRVYVGNLDWNVSWQDLKDHMRSAGEVAYANIMTERGGRSKGCGIVQYETVEGAKAAIQTLHDTTFRERKIFVREDRGAPKPKGMPANGDSEQSALADDAQSRRVYVGNLDWDLSWQDLKDHMRAAGEVAFVDLFTEPGGRSKGCGIVEYKAAEGAKAACETLHDSTLGERKIIVREDKGARSG